MEYREGRGEIVSSTEADLAAQDLLMTSRERAKDLARDSLPRKAIPIRKTFLRVESTEQGDPPLSRIVSRRGRGGALAVRLYIALVWRCSGGDFDTQLSSRQFAELLGLADPGMKGARNVAKAIQLLKELNLISVERQRGEPSKITLLDESGDKSPYTLPSTEYKKNQRSRDVYFKVPVRLWTAGLIQDMSANALAMLLILLAEEGGIPVASGATEGKPVWWSTKLFPTRYRVSPAMRSRGGQELIAQGLLYISRESLGPAGSGGMKRERVRNKYQLQNQALVYPDKKAKPEVVLRRRSHSSRRRTQGRKSSPK